MRLWFHCFLVVALLAFIPGPTQGADLSSPQLIEDFDGTWRDGGWQFYEGREFPGAKGAFGRTETGHTGHGGSLDFDFTGGGNYVSALLPLENIPQLAAVRFWLKKPRGNQLKFRYTDQSGQTLQRSFWAPDDTWADVQVNLTGWSGHWGGANDGTLHGPPRMIHILVENTGNVRGRLLFDDVRLVPGMPDATLGMVESEYVAMRFEELEGWHSFGSKGDPGTTALEGQRWRIDFTRGAQRVGIAPIDRCLLGTPQQFRIRFRGKADGHKLHLRLATHFQNFSAASAPLRGDGDHEITFEAPPGPGWHWFDGENDGALHGPLRIRELSVSGEGRADKCELELIDIRVKASYPPQRAIVALAGLRRDHGKPRFVATLRSMRMDATEATVTCTIRDWEDKTLSSEQRSITMPPAAEPVTMTVPLPTGDHTFLEAEFAVAAPNEIVAPARAYATAPLDSSRDARLQPASPFGMGLYLYRYPNTPQGLADMEKAASLAQKAGVKWSREEFNWTRIEREKGKFDWSFYDQVVATAQRHGITIYGLLAYWSPWTKPYTPEGIADYCRFAAAAAERYRDEIRHWEVWNEPNIFFWQGPRDIYAELLKQAHASIKTANTNALVLGCSTAGIDLKFIRRTMELGAPFDILTIHPYRGALYDEGFVANLQEVATLTRPRPLWITEMGWGTHVPHNSMGSDFVETSQREQAALLARAYLDAIGSGVVANMSWYNFRNDGDDPLNFESNMGIMERDFMPKPAYRAFAVMTLLLHDKFQARPLRPGDGVIGYQFQSGAKDDKPVIALWKADKDELFEFPSQASMVLTDLMGDSRPLTSEQGKVRVPLRKDVPVFLQER